MQDAGSVAVTFSRKLSLGTSLRYSDLVTKYMKRVLNSVENRI